MREAEEIITQALSTYGIPPKATRNLIQRARKRSGLGESPADWLALAEGPLLEEIQRIIPVFNLSGEYARAVEALRELVSAQALAEREGGGGPRRVAVEDAEERSRLVREFARERGVVGVGFVSERGFELRFRELSEGLGPMILAAHRLFGRRRPYRVAYLVVEEAALFMRPLGSYVFVVAARRGRNLGRLLSRLLELEAEGGRE